MLHRMRVTVAIMAVCGVVLVSTGCQRPQIQANRTTQVIDRVMKVDGQLRKKFNSATPVTSHQGTELIGQLGDALEQVDLSDCPDEFRNAYPLYRSRVVIVDRANRRSGPIHPHHQHAGKVADSRGVVVGPLPESSIQATALASKSVVPPMNRSPPGPAARQSLQEPPIRVCDG